MRFSSIRVIGPIPVSIWIRSIASLEKNWFDFFSVWRIFDQRLRWSFDKIPKFSVSSWIKFVRNRTSSSWNEMKRSIKWFVNVQRNLPKVKQRTKHKNNVTSFVIVVEWEEFLSMRFDRTNISFSRCWFVDWEKYRIMRRYRLLKMTSILPRMRTKRRRRKNEKGKRKSKSLLLRIGLSISSICPRKTAKTRDYW